MQSFTYTPGPYRRFEIFEPKQRLISAAFYRDRVVHHALSALVVPPLEQAFLPTSYASCRGYGRHRTLRRFVRECRRHKCLFQADLRLYAPSLDHTVLRAQLAKRIACRGTLWMLDRILANGASLGLAIECFPCDTLFIPMERPRCLPIGNLTSQIRCT